MHHTHRLVQDRSSSRLRHARRLGAPECLEARALMAATIYTVDALTDTGAGSGTAGDLRYVIDEANADPNPDGSLIRFAPTVFARPQTITLSSPLVLSEAGGPEVISGPGANLVTISGNHDVQAFSVAGGVTATLEGLTIANGSGSLGGDISNNGGTLTVSDSTLANGSASLGGGIFNNGGTLTVSDSTLANGSAELGGGILNNGGTLTVSDSTLANNSGFYSGGGIDNLGTLVISGSTLAHDSAADGGAIDNEQGSIAIVNSTLAGNSAVDGGALDLTSGLLTAVNDTFAYNTAALAGAGGGIYIDGGIATLSNTIVATNTRFILGGTTPDDISVDGGGLTPFSSNNLIGSGGSGGLVGVADNQVGVTRPDLGPLAYNGGPTQTIALLPGSPAIAGGSAALAVDPTTGLPLQYDQRGTGFDRATNGVVDVGAFQYLPAVNDAVTVHWGTAGSAPLVTAADGLQLLPEGRKTDLPWTGIRSLQITLGQAQALTAADVAINSAVGVDYGPISVSGSGTHYTITLSQPIDTADRVTLTIVNPGVSIFTRQIDVLPGDVNDDGVVNSQDDAAFRAQWLGANRTYSIFDDINGDGQVNVEDYELIRAAIGTSLPGTARSAGSSPASMSPAGGTTNSAAPGGRVTVTAATTPASPQSVLLPASHARGQGQGQAGTSKDAVNGQTPLGAS